MHTHKHKHRQTHTHLHDLLVGQWLPGAGQRRELLLQFDDSFLCTLREAIIRRIPALPALFAIILRNLHPRKPSKRVILHPGRARLRYRIVIDFYFGHIAICGEG